MSKSATAVVAMPENPTDDARAALQEVTDATQQADQVVAEIKGNSVVQSVVNAVTDNEVTQLRERARKERARGKENMAKRYEGVASVIIPVEISERVVGSAFERFFPVIENGMYVISKRGEMFMGTKATEAVLETISSKVAAMEQNVAADLAGLKIQMDVHGSSDDFITPEYVKPAASHQVQVRTRMAAAVCKLFIKQDEVVKTLQTLAWNGQVENSSIDEQEYKIKKEVRDLAQFIARTLRGMRNKVAAKTAVASAELSEKAEAA